MSLANTFDLRRLGAPTSTASAALQRGSGKRLLCISHVLPYPPRAGNEQRIHRLLRWLAGEGWDVLVVLCPAHVPSPQQLDDLTSAYPSLVVCLSDGTVLHHLPDRGLRLEVLRGRPIALDALWPAPPAHEPAAARLHALEGGFCPDALVRLVWHLDRTWRPDVVLAEYAFMTRPFPLLRPEVLKVVDTIDVFSSKAAKVERHGVTDGYGLSQTEEAGLLGRADVLIGIQPDESEMLAALVPGASVVTVGLDLPVAEVGLPTSEEPSVLLVGSDNPMNVRGLHDFVEHAWPLVRAEVPAATLRVVGRVGGSVDRSPDGVELLGVVDDLDAEYRRARVAINPAVAGTGLKVKTIEALSHLRPIVAWPAGVDGLDSTSRSLCRVARDWADFAGHVVDLATTAHGALVIEQHRPHLAGALSAEGVYRPLADALARTSGVATSATGPRRPAGSTRQRRVITLLARHGTDRYADALPALRARFAQQMPDVVHDVLVIDTDLPARSIHPDRAVELIGGSNASWEFSAWDDGIAHLGARLGAYDLVHLATSAFGQLHVRHLDRFDTSTLQLLGTDRVALGHIDRYQVPVTLLGETSQSWLRSSFVFVAPQVLRDLGSLVGIGDRSAFFSGDATRPFRPDAPLSASYRRNIVSWLTGEGTGQGVAWHSRFDLSPGTLAAFEDKTIAILNEQLLTNRLRASGCAVVDVTWLATVAAEGSLGTIPSWQEQLAGRDVDAVAWQQS